MLQPVVHKSAFAGRLGQDNHLHLRLQLRRLAPAQLFDDALLFRCRQVAAFDKMVLRERFRLPLVPPGQGVADLKAGVLNSRRRAVEQTRMGKAQDEPAGLDDRKPLLGHRRQKGVQVAPLPGGELHPRRQPAYHPRLHPGTQPLVVPFVAHAVGKIRRVGQNERHAAGRQGRHSGAAIPVLHPSPATARRRRNGLPSVSPRGHWSVLCPGLGAGRPAAGVHLDKPPGSALWGACGNCHAIFSISFRILSNFAGQGGQQSSLRRLRVGVIMLRRASIPFPPAMPAGLVTAGKAAPSRGQPVFCGG